MIIPKSSSYCRLFFGAYIGDFVELFHELIFSFALDVNYPGSIAGYNRRITIRTLLEITFIQCDIYSVIDNHCRPVVVLFVSEATVKETDILNMAQIPGIGGDRSHFARETFIVFLRFQRPFGSRVAPLLRNTDIIELDILYGTAGFAPDNGRHLAVLEIGETVGHRYILECDVPDGPTFVRTFGHTGDVRNLDEDRRKGFLHPYVFVVNAVDNAAVVGCDAYTGFAGTQDPDVLETDVFK
jgi:hypothetical protein